MHGTLAGDQIGLFMYFGLCRGQVKDLTAIVVLSWVAAMLRITKGVRQSFNESEEVPGKHDDSATA
jgi:hypothetical protein